MWRKSTESHKKSLDLCWCSRIDIMVDIIVVMSLFGTLAPTLGGAWRIIFISPQGEVLWVACLWLGTCMELYPSSRTVDMVQHSQSGLVTHPLCIRIFVHKIRWISSHINERTKECFIAATTEYAKFYSHKIYEHHHPIWHNYCRVYTE